MSKQYEVSAETEEKARLYFEENMSISEIAEKYNVYPKKIQRELKKAGYELRSRSEAQKLRLESGKAKHPTEGKEVSLETKYKIAESMHNAWQGLSDADRAKRIDTAREVWKNRDDKEEFIKAGQEAIQKTAKEGSKFEKFLANRIQNEGFLVLAHQKHEIGIKNMHLDLLLPEEKIAIEVDGPAHYEKLYSQQDLEASKARDESKNGRLISDGYSIIRVAQPSQVSDWFLRTQSTKVVEKIMEIKDNTSPSINYINTEEKNG